MPSAFTDHRDRWLQLSEVDYLGQFVKGWLAFNAWYRGISVESQDRKIIEHIKWAPNQVSAKFRPLLEYTSEEAEQFRTEIGLLHHRLERYEIYNGKGDEKTRIRLSSIVIRTEPADTASDTYRNYTCKVDRAHNGKVAAVVRNPTGLAVINLQNHDFNLTDFEALPAFGILSVNVKQRFRACYQSMNPRIPRDLTAGTEAAIACGTHQFRSGPEFLFAGVIEAIYLMRCSLFHGELIPTPEASECYEPAFRIVRRFLHAVT